MINIATGFVVSLAFIYLMSAFAEVIAWLCVALIQIGLIACTVGVWFLFDAQKKLKLEKDTYNTDNNID